MKGFWKDFKAFITKGNIMDLAVAVVIGGAFNKIVTSLVNDIIMPLIGLAVGGLSVSDMKHVFKEAVLDAEGNVVTAESALTYGAFIQTIIDFLIVAICIFAVLRAIMKAKEKLNAKSIEEEKAKKEAEEAKKKAEDEAAKAKKEAEEAKAKADHEEQMQLLRDIAKSLRK